MKMKKKKGFTLIEIIICIAMLAIISVGSVVGINLVNKNLIIKELNQITNKAIQAAQVYIETNKEAQNQLYTEQNAVKIPIKVLVNEGLLSLKGTKLDNSKIKDEYVITALSTESGNSTECTNIDSKASWDNDKVIYICTYNKANDGNDSSNIIGDTNEYIAKGANPNNWIKFDELYCRIARGSSREDKCGYEGKPTDYRGQKESYFRILNIKNNEIEIIFTDTNYISPTVKKSSDGYFYNSTNSYPDVCGENCRTTNTNSSIRSSLFYVGNERCFKKYEDVKRSIVNFGIITYESVENSNKASSRMLLYNEYINTFEEGVTWLPNSLYLGSYTKNDGKKSDIVYNGGTYNYVYPIFRVVLSDKVELVKEDCANSKTAGSVDCPYKINVKEDNYCELAW